MRNIYTTAMMIAGLMLAAPAMAEENEGTTQPNVHQHQFLSKRPYQAPVVAAKEGGEGAWVGARAIAEQERKEQHLNVLKMHNIGRRP